MKGIFGRPAFLLAFVIHAAMKCQAKFFVDREQRLGQELYHHSKRCSYHTAGKKSQCCEAEKSSLDERDTMFR